MDEKFQNNLPKLPCAYLARRPTNRGVKTPLLIMFHGYGSNEEDLFDLCRDAPSDFLVISVRAPQVLSYSQYSWFSYDWSSGFPEADIHESNESRLYVKKLIEEIILTFNIDPSQIYLLGFSQGAELSLSIALSFTKLIRGVVVLSGKLSEETKATLKNHQEESVPNMFWGHGRLDPVIPFRFAEEGKEILEKIGAPLSFHEYPIGHGVSPQEERDIAEWFISVVNQNKAV